MKPVVIDASAALAWMLKSQSTNAAMTFLVDRDAMIFEAPAVFEWEVRNVLLSLDRRGALTARDYDEALAIHDDLDVRLNAQGFALHELATLAREARLSLFDASYLALALDRGWALASRDEALLTTAMLAGVECFDLRSAA